MGRGRWLRSTVTRGTWGARAHAASMFTTPRAIRFRRPRRAGDNGAVIATWRASSLGGKQMAVQAFILIDTSPGKAKAVATKLRSVAGVSAAHAATGPHDIIAIAEATDVSSLGELIVHKIQSIPGGNRNLTSIVAD